MPAWALLKRICTEKKDCFLSYAYDEDLTKKDKKKAYLT